MYARRKLFLMKRKTKNGALWDEWDFGGINGIFLG